jgi:phosphoadenosine phosphosulfate reductase
MIPPEEMAELNARLATAPAEEILTWAWERFGSGAAIGTSFQGAGLVLMHLARTQGLGFPLFTIDTGLLFPETLELKVRLEALLERPIESLVPDLTVDAQAAAHGPELWRRDPDLCCTLRKVLPLRDRLTRLDAWITGLRREQSDSRAGIGILEQYDLEDPDPAGNAPRSIVKLNPLAGWSRDAVWEYLRKHGVPTHPLHARGYRSIGCQPCTAKAADGGSERAGRWIGFNKTECGIHTFLRPRA